ncbi:MAG: YraN family protein [Armatimonadetes bacterium]|nr:YraN family protein [Armatimonadota bacterium]
MSRTRGTEAEDRAADFLLAKGYTLLRRRYKAREGEIDVVALDGEVLVVAEVKLRTTGRTYPEETLTPDKKRRLVSAARQFKHEHELGEKSVRFDLVAIDADEIRHYEDVFQPEGD